MVVVVVRIIKKETTTTKKKSNFFATETTVFFQSGFNRTRLKRGVFVARACKAERRMMMNWKNRFVKVISNSILSKTKRAFVEKESPRMRGPPNDNNTTVGVEEDDEEQKEAPRRHRA